MDFIDWSQVVWTDVIVYSVLVLIAAFIGNFINIIFNGNPITGAIIIAVLFGALYIGWKYYPHGIEFGGEQTTQIERVETTDS